MRLPGLLLGVLLGVAAPGPGAADPSCAELRRFYTGKGFLLAGVPQTEISGDHLRTCPQGPTCCTASMEEKLLALSHQETESLIREAGRSLQGSISSLQRSFDTYFTDLHARSERSLQVVLSPLGTFYPQNRRLFSDLYADLRQYYRGSALNLDDNLSDFWARLLERTFRSSTPHTVDISDDYLECVAKQQETLRPFGDVPRDMKTKLVAAFVSARSFSQSLTVSGEVVRRVSQVPLSPDCVTALMKLLYCPHCSGVAPPVPPCSSYCSNVMKGCLGNQADLDPEWQNLIDSMLQVISSFNSNRLDVILSSIPTRIYEAVNFLQDNMESFTAKVYQTCGTPGEPGTGSPSVPEPKRKSSSSLTQLHPENPSGQELEMQMSDVSSKLKDFRLFWLQLSEALCTKISTGRNSEEKEEEQCWNGVSRGRYLPPVVGDGLAQQVNNPEVEVDITQPDLRVRQQILQLKMSSSRLMKALQGHDVDFQDHSDDVSGSGSGMCVGVQCPRGQPRLYASFPDDNRVRGAATPLPRPPLVVLLLLHLLLLQQLQR